jgi:hypothetical protein
MLYLIDLLILNQPRRYLSSIPNYVTPIVIAIYSILTISLGDYENREKFLLPLIKNFYREVLDRSA